VVEYLRVFHHVGFFGFWWYETVDTSRDDPMDKSSVTVAQQIAQAAVALQEQRTGKSRMRMEALPCWS
jgi:hypothetical protein